MPLLCSVGASCPQQSTIRAWQKVIGDVQIIQGVFEKVHQKYCCSFFACEAENFVGLVLGATVGLGTMEQLRVTGWSLWYF